MRYSTPIYFQQVIAGEYDRNTGNYADDTITETKRYASVTDAGKNTLNLLYGEIKEGAVVARIQRPYVDEYSRIRIGDAVYRVDLCRRNKVFILSEVQ